MSAADPEPSTTDGTDRLRASGPADPAEAIVESLDGEPPDAATDAGIVGTDQRPAPSVERRLGDFTTTPAILRLVPLALLIGALGAGVSLALLDMIGFFTNLFYYQRL